jgi:hypothetical protein
MPRAYDLVGSITAPAEVFPRLHALEKMAASLRSRGMAEAADETLELLAEARTFEASMRGHASRLRRLWAALEATEGPVPPEAQAAATRGIAAASLHYRNLRE